MTIAAINSFLAAFARPAGFTLSAQRKFAAVLAVLVAAHIAINPLAAQDLQTFDPDDAFANGSQAAPRDSRAGPAIDADLASPNGSDAESSPSDTPLNTPLPVAKPLPAQPADNASGNVADEFAIYAEPPRQDAGQTADSASAAPNSTSGPATGGPVTEAADQNTYAQDDLIGAAEGVFGKGARGLAKLIEDLLKKEGEPNGYIVGREAGGAFIVGARYGSGTLHHKIEGERKVYWTGPSVGFDAGANAANTFVLVYNLWDSEDLFKRYPAGEGQAYFVGGLHASYVRRGDVVLIPIRMGAGVRLGINAGYMRFSKKQRWLPF